MEHLVSIIVPIYNVENYLEKCLTSILAQSYSQIEVLMINDGSTDNSLEIMDDFSKKDSRFLSFTKENGGLSDARNYGIEHATGEYLVFVDSDDYIVSTFVEDLLYNLIDSNTDISVGDMTYLYENGNKEFASGGNFEIESFAENEMLLLINNSACNKLYKKYLFDIIRFPKGLWYEDLATIPIVVAKANSISKVNKELYIYYQRTGSIAHSANKKIFDIYTAINMVEEYLTNHNQKVDGIQLLYLIHGLDITTVRIKDFDQKEVRLDYLKENMQYLNKYYPKWDQSGFVKKSSFKKKLIYKLLKYGMFKQVLFMFDLKGTK